MKKYLALVILISAAIWGSGFSSAAKPSDLGLKEGDLISAIFSDDPDVYIVNEHGYKRLFLNPEIFKFYGHLGGFAKVNLVTPEIRDAFPTSGYFRDCESNDRKVYGVEVKGEDTGELRWIDVSGNDAVKNDPNFFKKVFCINNKEFDWYPKGKPFTTVTEVPFYSRGGGGSVTSVAPATPAVPATPAIPASPSQPHASPTPISATPAKPATPAVPASTQTPTPIPTPTPTPTPIPDTLGPWIVNLSISPTNGYERETITFTVTAEDSTGIGNIIYDIRYPNDGRWDAPYYLRPNCNFFGAKSGTCTFSESIDHATEPQLYGEYVIEKIRAQDILGNVSIYYPDRTVSKSLQNNHNLTIPIITITAAPITPILNENFNGYTNGSIVGQGGWYDRANGLPWVVEGSIVQEGAKAIYNNNTGADSVITKNNGGNKVTDGKQSFYVRTQNRSNWSNARPTNFQLGIFQGSWDGPSRATLGFERDGHVNYVNGSNDARVNFSTYVDSAWNLVEIEWRSSDASARYRINNGTWTSWIPFTGGGSFTGFDTVGFVTWYLGDGGVYIDYLH